MLDRSVTYPGPWQKRLLTVEPDDHPVGAQLMGDDPEGLAQAARLMGDAGYDVIDLNFACPAPRIVNRGHGGCLLAQPELLLQIVERVVKGVGDRCPVTVKLRRGYDDSPASERSFFAILDGVLRLGVAAVTLHPRTVVQHFRGHSDWSFLARVKKHVGDRTVLGSGDLRTAEDVRRMLDETGVDGVALARGAIGKPWFFRDCLALAAGGTVPAPPTEDELQQNITQHYAEFVRCYGEEVAGWKSYKHLLKYGCGHPLLERQAEFRKTERPQRPRQRAGSGDDGRA
jgi:nifR3 family TIM-barrel protein